ncbi:Endoplasmic reticulum-Golgi intermediate compartment protein 3 [Boothiomyces sp. JEL0866]|nr:Endoplasmic reticulum-Golgi intermediate compartment protein 3 [Boothiomyces sp. JEL0866]KAJ3324569.1 Endoplasmic reticulum-Golgi intermediate compartment protein 3 [Boothiomyces sp. JEL0866]
MDLRRRAVPQVSPANEILSTLKSYDAYAKPLEDFRIKTLTGASVTLVSTFIIFFLVLSEFADWINVEMVPSLVVDTSRMDKMQINIDMTFPKIPCFLLSIDVMDVAGEHQNGADHLMHKSRLDQSGKLVEKKRGTLGDANKEMNDARNKTLTPGYCGSCYGASMPNSGCCNTCDDVRLAYQKSGWGFEDPDKYEQCVHEGYSKMVKEQAHEGCNLSGYVQVSKVQGNFHFAPGPSFEIQGMHAHDLNDYRNHKQDWDFTHTINHLSFGQNGGFTNPLDGVSKKATGAYNTFQYYIKVVSTEFTYRNGSKLLTNQFAATEHQRDVTPMFGNIPTTMPGVFFNYDISPMLIQYKEYRKPFTHFITDLCAIVGGVFTVAGMVDGLLYTAEKRLLKKTELGKQG